MNINNQIIIGICGKAGSGKDTIADHIVEWYGFKKLCFADPLKRACSEAFGIPLSHFYDTTLKEVKDPYWHVSPRQIAQYVGTELFRDSMQGLKGVAIQKQFWVYRFLKDVVENSNISFVVSDVRFNNEAEVILNRGGYLFNVISNRAPESVGISNHASEAGIDFSKLPHQERIYEIKNDTDVSLFELKSQVNQIFHYQIKF